jgi:hypothetical protein
MTETPNAEALPPHFRCDCVPDLGPAHCHRCSRGAGSPVQWDNAPCRDWVESPAYAALLAAHADDALLVISEAFDAQAADAAKELTQEPEPAAESVPEPVDTAPVVNTAPAVVPAPPKTPLVAVSRRHERGTHGSRWGFTNLARTQLADLSLTEQEVEAILESPHVQAQSPSGTAVNHYGDDLLIMVDVNGDCIISVIERKMHTPAGDERSSYSTSSPGSPAKQKSHSGGPGRRMPSTSKEFLAMLKEHGFTTVNGGQNHHLATHPGYPDVRVAVPSTPSDRRSYPNLIADIKRRTGIDITKKKEG